MTENCPSLHNSSLFYHSGFSSKHFTGRDSLRGQYNAYVERVNGIIKNEYLKYWTINSLEQLRNKLDRAVKHYNDKRAHRSLPGRLSPIEFEERIKKNPQNYKLNEWIYSEKLNINQKKCNFEISDLTEKTLVCPISDY